MAYKPEIQYIGQFYVHGSEARELARQQEKKQAKTTLPEQGVERVRKVHVDLLAISSLVLAAVLLVTMVVCTMGIQDAWAEMEVAQKYVTLLEKENRILAQNYRSGYDLEQVRSAALALGMVSVEEAQTMQVRVSIPQPEPERTLWDDIVWFMEGLFA